MGKTVKVPWTHKMGQMMSCGGSNPRAFEKSTDRGKHMPTTQPHKHALQHHSQCPRNERESLAANKKRKQSDIETHEI